MQKVKDRIEKITGLSSENVDLDIIKYILKRKNVQSTKNILEYNKPSTLEELYEMLMQCQQMGTAITLDKCILMYGLAKGTDQYNKYKKSIAITLDNMIKKYGLEEGTTRYTSYCNKQAYTNSLEYKKEKYGMTDKEFKEFNLSRSITLDNMIKKYGLEEGTTRYTSYCNKQAYTNSKEYLQDRYDAVCKSKALTLDNYILKYGKEEGTLKFQKYIESSSISGYSKISQELFWELIKHNIFGTKYYFAEYNFEYAVMDIVNKSYKKYDFVSLDLNLCIEYHGDHYHGNPKIYSPNDYLKGKGCTKIKVSEKWIEDDHKQTLLKDTRNIETIVIWDSEYRTNKKETVEKIINYVKNRI